MLKCVIFDMDGTLLDTERLAIGAWQRAGRKYGREIPADFIVSYFGMSAAKIDALYFARFGADFPMAAVRAERVANGVRYVHENPVPVKPGAPEILAHLRRRGVKIALATSTESSRAIFQLDKCGLLPFFDTLVTGEMVTNGKPAPDIFQEALRRAAVAPAEALVIEDTENGARAALAASCRTIIVPDMRAPGNEIRARLFDVCDSLFDVIPIIDQLLSASARSTG